MAGRGLGEQWGTLNFSLEHLGSLYIYHFSTVIDFSLEKYSGKLSKLNSFPAIAFELYSSMARALGL